MRDRPVRLLAALLAVVVGFPLSGLAAPPIPDYTGQRVTVLDEPAEVYRSLGDQIAAIEKKSRQTYYIVVVPTSGEGPAATRDFTDALYRKWLSQSAGTAQRLDPDRSVIF